MNERINQLAEQAGFENGHQDRYGNSYEYELEKFAELIIRECAEFARQHNLEKADRSHMIHKAIKQHFGVDEPEDSTCPDCGADGGTQCGSINCGY
jgi:hypothetical protein